MSCRGELLRGRMAPSLSPHYDELDDGATAFAARECPFPDGLNRQKAASRFNSLNRRLFLPGSRPVDCRAKMFRNYLAVAVRNLARNRLYASINIAGLAVGFCAALLIVLYVRSEYSYDHFFPGYRDVYLVTSYREVIDRRLKSDPQDTSFPDLAAKLSGKGRVLRI